MAGGWKRRYLTSYACLHTSRYVETYRTIVRGACDEGEEDDGDTKPSASSSSGGSASKGRKRGAGGMYVCMHTTALGFVSLAFHP